MSELFTELPLGKFFETMVEKPNLLKTNASVRTTTEQTKVLVM